jgi:gas vesicle protein
VSRFPTPSGQVELDMNPGIKKVTKDIDKLIANYSDNSKVAEELCTEIGFHLNRAGELSDRLAKYIKKISKDYEEYFENNKSSTVTDICTLYQDTNQMLSEVGMQMRKTSTLFTDDMQRLFSFGNYENEGLQKFIELRNSFCESYEEAKINLERKKALLFEQKDPRKWGVDPAKTKLPIETLLKNQTLAKKFMLPQVDPLHKGNKCSEKFARFCGFTEQATPKRNGHLHRSNVRSNGGLLQKAHQSWLRTS